MRQTGYEQDWINAMNAAGGLANTFRAIKSSELQDAARQKELDDRKALDDSASFYTKGLDAGMSTDQIRTSDRIAAPSTVHKMDEFTKGLSDKDVAAINDFSTSSDAVNPMKTGKISPFIEAEGLKAAMDTHITNLKNSTDSAAYGVYQNLMKQGPDALNNFQPKDLPETIALGWAAKQYAANDEVRKQMADNREAASKSQYVIFKKNLEQANALKVGGKTGQALQVYRDTINGTPNNYRAEITPDGKGLQMSVVDHDGTVSTGPVMGLDEVQKYLGDIDETTFGRHSRAVMQDRLDYNHQQLEHPVYMKKGNQIARVFNNIHPTTGNKVVLNFDLKSGKPLRYGTSEDMLNDGWVPAKDPDVQKHIDLENEGLVLRNKHTKAEIAHLNKTTAELKKLPVEDLVKKYRTTTDPLLKSLIGSQLSSMTARGDKLNLDEQKKSGEMRTTQFINSAMAAGIPIDAGGKLTRALNASEKQKLDALSAKTNIYPVYDTVSNWGGLGADTYNIKGLNPYPLDTVAPTVNSTFSNERSALEFNPGKAPKKGSVMNSLTPKGSWLDKATDFIGNTAKGVGNVVVSPLIGLGAGTRALSLSLQRKSLENQLTYDPTNMELRKQLADINSKIDSLSSSNTDEE